MNLNIEKLQEEEENFYKNNSHLGLNGTEAILGLLKIPGIEDFVPTISFYFPDDPNKSEDILDYGVEWFGIKNLKTVEILNSINSDILWGAK